MIEKQYEPSVAERNNFKSFYNEFLTNVVAAQEFVKNNNQLSLALHSQNINDLISYIYSSNIDEEALQDAQNTLVLQYIGLPPVLWVKNQSYKRGDVVYINAITDTYLYYCVKNIDVSINVNNTLYWTKMPNYYQHKNLQFIFQQWVDRLKINQYPAWDSEVIYYKNNIVLTPDNDIALCITTNNQGTQAPLSSTADWVIFMLQGRKGVTSLGVSYNGMWVNGSNYSTKTMVTYVASGITYIYISRNDITNSITPPIDDSDNWFLISQAGGDYILVTDSVPSDLSKAPSVVLQIEQVSKSGYSFYIGQWKRNINNTLQDMNLTVLGSKLRVFNLNVYQEERLRYNQIDKDNTWPNWFVNIWRNKNLHPNVLGG